MPPQRIKQFVPLNEQRAGNGALRRMRDLICQIFRHRLTPDVASLTAESGIRARPGGETTDAIEDFLGGERPVDEAVLLFEHGGARGMLMILRARNDRARGQAPKSFHHKRSTQLGQCER